MTHPNEAAAEDGLTAEESQPLLDNTLNSWSFDLEELRRRAAQQEPLEDYRYIEYDNQAWFLVLSHMARAITQVTVVLGAYFFLHSVGGRSITPHCDEYEQASVSRYSVRRWQEYTCYFTTACFWTYPIVCPLAIVILFWTNLLDKRLFYECLFNRVFLQQHSMSYLTSWTFWLLLLYFLCGMSCVLFTDFHRDELIPREEMIFGIFAYLSSTVAFLYILFTNWSVNRLVVPLPMFVENDLDGAMSLLRDCTFIRDVDFWHSFRAAEALWEQVCQQRRLSFTMNTQELLRLVLDIQESFEGGRCSIFRRDSLVEKVQFHTSDFYERNFRSYWVSRFLYFPALQDQRSHSFRLWSRVYYAFMLFATFSFCYTLIYTFNKLLLFQETLDISLPLPAPHRVPGMIEDAAKKLPDLLRDGAESVPIIREIVPPVTCSVSDGSSFSDEYPCACGAETCLVNEACFVHSNACTAATSFDIQWPCPSYDIDPPRFHKEGTTASGAPVFTNGKYWIYHDPNCDGDRANPRWIINDIKPDLEAASDLDGDKECNYFARADSTALTGPPSGEWMVACDNHWQSMDIEMRMATAKRKRKKAYSGGRL